jgi:LCP family protein required for cell wall assembly
MALMVMTLVLPGSAQLLAGNRRVGRLALRTWLVLVVGFVLTLLTGVVWHELAFWLVSNTLMLGLLRFALMLLAIGWAGLFVDAWRIGQPLTLGMGHRRAAVGVNGVLCLSVAGSLLFGAHLVGVQRDFMLTMFNNGTVHGAHDGRFNVLLVGGDSGAGRWGLRPDSMTVASIDADTGRTVLIALPRNMENFPFRKGSVMDQQFPDGFDADYLNGVSTWAGDNLELFPHTKTPGMDATISAIEGITGLRINYWAMVNLQGFKDLVDAVGGVELNVRQKIPVGLPSDSYFHYIDPGKRTLNGVDTLWFARARYDSDDYSRMARQKCVMSAMLQQVSPQTAVTNFQKIAKASSAMVSTDIPRGEVDTFVDLALKAKSQKIATLSLVPPMINTAHPDIALVQQKVQAAIDRSEGVTPAPKTSEAAPAPAPETTEADTSEAPAGTGGGATAPAAPTTPAAPPSVTGGSLGSLSEGYAANESEDLGAVC